MMKLSGRTLAVAVAVLVAVGAGGGGLAYAGSTPAQGASGNSVPTSVEVSKGGLKTAGKADGRDHGTTASGGGTAPGALPAVPGNPLPASVEIAEGGLVAEGTVDGEEPGTTAPGDGTESAEEVADFGALEAVPGNPDLDMSTVEEGTPIEASSGN